ncbi:hypothetical protein FB451DRAFT_1186831 [Mycena latifolia]|nr:hypothetical protein FB451DRAFT_1186831 [Mycena latifolia]
MFHPVALLKFALVLLLALWQAPGYSSCQCAKSQLGASWHRLAPHVSASLSQRLLCHICHRRLFSTSMAHPPLRSKYTQDGPTDYELRAQRHLARNEKARLRMASKRAELKTRPLEEQARVAECNKGYQATYRERHRRDLRIWEAQRRAGMYMARYGPEAYKEYDHAQRERKLRARRKKRAMEAYHGNANGVGAATNKSPAATDKSPAATDKSPAVAHKMPAAADKRPRLIMATVTRGPALAKRWLIHADASLMVAIGRFHM